MWENITKVSLFEDFPSSVLRLTRTIERFNASRYFASEASSVIYESNRDSNTSLQYASWLIWASITSIPSASESDLLSLDLNDMGVSELWRKSIYRRQIYEDPLLITFFELRNYEVHVEIHKCDVNKFVAYSGSSTTESSKLTKYENEHALFISKIEYDALLNLRNIKENRSLLSREMVDWFNLQSRKWPSTYLIGEARERYALYLTRFLSSCGIN